MTTNEKIGLGVGLALLAFTCAFIGGKIAGNGSPSEQPPEEVSLGTAAVNYFEAGVRWIKSGLYVGDEQQFFVNEDGEATIGGATFYGLSGSIDAGAQVDYWQNTTGATVYVTGLVGGYSSGTASSTFALRAFATTTAPSVFTSTYALTRVTEAINGGSTFLIAPVYATSTAATTTNSVMENQVGRGNGMVAVPNGGYLVVLLQNAGIGLLTPDATCNGAVCEEATSTNRGFDPFWKAQYIR